jgi:hypothetical protein
MTRAGHEGAAPVSLRKRFAVVEGESERRRMRADRIVGNDRLRDEVRTLTLVAWVLVLAEVGIGPAVECAVLHARDVIGDEVVAEPVALVDRGP